MKEFDFRFVDETVARLGGRPEAVIPILQAIQEHYRYLPQEALERVCSQTEIQPAAITGVATFYSQFRRRPVGRHIISICHGTACHVQDAGLVHEELAHHLGLTNGQDTDAKGIFTVEKVACLGCCTLAPVIKVEQDVYGRVKPRMVAGLLKDYLRQSDGRSRKNRTARKSSHAFTQELGEVRVGLGSCCQAQGSGKVYQAIANIIAETGMPAVLKGVGCTGMCHQTPLVEIIPPAGSSRSSATSSKCDRNSCHAQLYAKVSPEDAAGLVLRHFKPRGIVRRVGHSITSFLDRMLTDEREEEQISRHMLDVRDPPVCAFLGRQKHLATEYGGQFAPLDLDEYLQHDGFRALRRCIEEWGPEEIIAEVQASGLRGRGGAGFPTGIKWAKVRAAVGQDSNSVKPCYIICNGDEGDPGAFMDRMILESFPYRVIEGMAIAARAVGAHEGFFYIRAEYPLAVERIRAALERCRERGLLGDSVLGSSFRLSLDVKEGAGAFICGEETALIASLEGRRGIPRLRPPYPAESGLWGRPTVVNNVETLALLPWIIRHGAADFAALGTEKSKGTKVFALAGKVRRGGLIEVPMGVTIREIVEEIGGGVPEGRHFKAVQVGGPSGGCIPAELGDTPVDYEALSRAGAIMGSGGLVVMDDSDCMVDIARYFVRFTQDQSCGKCTYCRIGTRRMLDILDRIATGKGKKGDIEELEALARMVGAGSICGLGKTAPNPVLSTLRYFRPEYEAHLQGRCPAGKCKDLIAYTINERCIGCTLCAQQCPVAAIPVTPYQRHSIDLAKCTRCDTCRQVCPEGAVDVR